MTASRRSENDQQTALSQLSPRVTPYSDQAESGVLGSILIDPEEAMQTCSHLEAAHFYLEGHKQVWEGMQELWSEGIPIDLITLSERMKQRGTLEKAGGIGYLVNLSSLTGTSAYAEHYAAILDEQARLRGVISQAGKAMNHAYAGELEEAEQALAQESELRVATNHTIHQSEVTRQLLLMQNEPDGLSTGFPELDDMLGGIRPELLYILAARPAMGKSALALNIAKHVAQQHRTGVLYASLEMPALELQQRMCSQTLGIPVKRVRERERHAMRMIEENMAIFNDVPMYYEDNQDMSIRDLERAARRAMRNPAGLGLIVVDYLQLITPTSSRRASSREQEISEISRSLKRLARRLKVPIIVLSQLSRALEARPNKRPMLSDLRESGSIEQDADVVLFIYRDDYYNKESEVPGEAEIIVGKQRAGELGTVKTDFQSHISRFSPRPWTPPAY